MRLMKHSRIQQYIDLFSDHDSYSDDTSTRKQSRSVGIAFRNSLAQLMKDLKRTTPHYIRCIKPNDTKSTGLFDGTSVLRQLRSGNILETVCIKQSGFPPFI